MAKRAFFAVVGSLVLFLSSAMAQPDTFNSLYGSGPRVPSLVLTNAATFTFATAFDFAGTPPADFLPPMSAPATTMRRPRASANVASTDFSKDASKEAIELKRTSLFDYATGEIGFLYGKSTGKYGVESEQGYIIGEVGNEHLHISAGASYENVNGRLPRFVR
jgi:hypothetical protein